MAFQPFISKPNPNAIALATAVYGVLYFIFIALLKASVAPVTLVSADTVGLWGNQLFMTVFGYMQYLLPGLLVGYLAEKSPMMHGYLLGVATTAFVYVYARYAYGDTPSLLPSTYTVLYTCFVAGVWCSLGAIISDHVKSSKRQPSREE